MRKENTPILVIGEIEQLITPHLILFASLQKEEMRHIDGIVHRLFLVAALSVFLLVSTVSATNEEVSCNCMSSIHIDFHAPFAILHPHRHTHTHRLSTAAHGHATLFLGSRHDETPDEAGFERSRRLFY